MAEATTKVQVRYGGIVFGQRGFWGLLVLLILAVYFSHYSLGILGVTIALVWLSSRFWALNVLNYIKIEENVSNCEVFPGEIISVEMIVTNNKWLPVPWLELSRALGRKLSGPDFPYQSGEGAREICRLGWLPAKQKQIVTYQVQPVRRGLYSAGAEQICSGDPFAFFQRVQDVKEPIRITVYPHLLSSEWLDFSRKDPLGPKPHLNFLFTDPLLASGVRDYQPFDTLRQINWVASARFQSLKSNIWEGKAAAICLIFLETKSLRNSNWSDEKKELAWEVLLSSVATKAMMLTDQRQEWSFFTDVGRGPNDKRPFLLLSRTNQYEQMRELMFFLAQMEREDVSLEHNVLLSQISMRPGATVIAFSAQICLSAEDILVRFSANRNVAWMLLEIDQNYSADLKSFPLIELVLGWEKNIPLAKLLLGRN